MEVKIKKLHPDAIIPTYGTDGAGAFDLYALEGGDWIENGDAYTFRTGLSFEIPEGYVMLAFSRSGMGFNYNIRLSNGVGVIDSMC